MKHLAVRLSDDRTEASCAVCANPADGVAGLQLCLTDGGRAVCRDCGKQTAPALVDLLDLVQAAVRVGGMSRRALWLPLETLLKLAQAAEKYAGRTPSRAA